MKEIFTDLYRKVLGFFQAQEKENNAEDVKTVAVNRMKLVLMQDRTNLTPFLLEKMRGEMIAVLAKYVEMDQEALELNFEQEGEQMALMLSIPVIRAKDEEEIQAIIEQEEKEASLAEAEEVSEEEVQDEKDIIQEEAEETDEDIEEETEEDVCSVESENEETIEASESPDEVETEEETSSTKKNKKGNK